jgi:plastocyanin
MVMRRFQLMNAYVAFVFVLAVAAIAAVTVFRPTEATATSSAADAPHPTADAQKQGEQKKGDIPNSGVAINGNVPLVAQAVTPTGDVAPAAVWQPKQLSVAIDNFNFTPRELSVSVGDTVTWVNHDDVPHTASSSDDPAAFDSKALDTDDKYSFTFAKPGTYKYYCKVHPHMTGSVVVR